MLILKLELPEETVHYNKLGKMTSAPAPFTPESVKGLQMELSITGYVSDSDFFAFKLNSPDRPLTTKEQFSLLSRLGFKTIPVHHYPQSPGSVDVLIRQKSRYEEYNPIWWDTDSGVEYEVPELTLIKDFDWTLDSANRLVRRLTTNLGQFDVIDHRCPEYYQTGLQIKVFKGNVYPYMTGPIMDPIPTHCPKCNNPLKKLQVASDLPLIFKCTAPICKKLDWTHSETELPIEEEVPADPDSFRDEVCTQDISNVSVTPKLKIINLECELSDDCLSKIELVDADSEFASADYIVTRTARSVTKRSRTISKERGIPLLPLTDLEAILNE